MDDLQDQIRAGFKAFREQPDNKDAESWEIVPYGAGFRDGIAHAEKVPLPDWVVYLRPGDTLVLSCAGRLREEARKYLEQRIAEAVPGNRCIVLEEGTTLQVLRPPPANAESIAPGL